MSYSSLAQQTRDPEFLERIDAAVQKEARNNPEFANTDYGKAIDEGRAGAALQFNWSVAVATEAAYEFAQNSGNEHPGGDPAVITDADILSSVQANWPPDPWPPVVATPPI